MKKTLISCSLFVLLSGCAWWHGLWSDSPVNNDEYSKLAVQAENEIKLADKTGFLWSNTEKMLSDSKEAKAAADKAAEKSDMAAAKSEFDKAMKLAQKAMKQAQLAQQQARDNANPAVSYR